jgi:hypothetical protein
MPISSTELPHVPAPGPPSTKATLAGALLIGSSLLSVLLMAHHPSVASHDTGAQLAEIAAKAGLSRMVHGGLLALMGAQAFAFVELSVRLGLKRPTVRAAALAYGTGFLAMTGAALISGFFISDLARRFGDGSLDASATFRPLLVASALANRTLARFATVATSIAIVLWSTALRGSSASLQLARALAFFAAVLPTAAIFAGALRLDVPGMRLVSALQAAWTIVIGVRLLRGDS